MPSKFGGVPVQQGGSKYGGVPVEETIPTVLPPAVAEFASSANRAILGGLDFIGPGAVNSALEVAGVDSRVPTLSGAASNIGVGDKGFMEPGLARDVVQAAGETAPIGLSAGQVARTAAQRLPQALPGESIARGATREFARTTPAQDVLAGGLSGAGAEVGQDLGGDVGQTAGAVIAPLAAVRMQILNAGGRKLIKEAAPTIDALKTEARGIYRKVDDLGVTVKADELGRLSNSIAESVKQQGFNARIHPKVNAALDEIADQATGDLTISELDVVRRVARAAAKSIEPDEARLGSMMVGKIDDFMDDIPPAAIRQGNSSEVGLLMRQGRHLWGRARRAEMLEDAVEKARNQASGFENGIRTQFRAILNSKKKSKGFTPDELDALKKVVRGAPVENTLRALGKFGFTEGQSSSMLLSSLGVAGGAAVGGGIGAASVPIIGQTSRAIAQRLTRENARLASDLVKSGNNAFEIAKSYARNTPKSQQSVEELTGMLLNANAKVAPARQAKNPLLANAATLASWISNLPDPLPEPTAPEESKSERRPSGSGVVDQP